MDLKANIYNNTYVTKIDNHIIEIEIANNTKIDYIKIWYNYKNNFLSTYCYYSIEEKSLKYASFLTERQAKILLKKINEAMELQAKMIK